MVVDLVNIEFYYKMSMFSKTSMLNLLQSTKKDNITRSLYCWYSVQMRFFSDNNIHLF